VDRAFAHLQLARERSRGEAAAGLEQEEQLDES
jgi:hypothetical protein